MFAKLLKMEFRSTWNVLGILCLSLVGAGLLGGLAIRYLEGVSAPKQWLEILLCELVITAAVLFFVVCGAAALIVQIVRFYRSRFTDEGYLTFTLPVTTHQVLLSSFVTSAVNLIAVAAVGAVGLILMGLCAIPDFEILRKGMDIFWQEFPELWARFTQADVLQAVGLLLVNAIVAFSNELILIMLAVTIGSLVAKKHKILAAVVFYYILHVVGLTFTGISMVNLLESNDSLRLLGLLALVNLIVAVAGYFLMYYLVDKKLNLN